jgi:hypothetical protein
MDTKLEQLKKKQEQLRLQIQKEEILSILDSYLKNDKDRTLFHLK